MNMSDYQWLKQVSAKNLSTTSIVTVTKFARYVRRLNGRVLSLRDPLLFNNMLEEVIVSNDPELTSMFKLVLNDIQKIAIKSGVDVPENLLVNSDGKNRKAMTYRGVPVKE